MTQGCLKGVDIVLKNLNTEIRKIKNRSEAGLLKAGLLVQKKAQEMAPVDTGNLKASAYTESIKRFGFRGPGVQVSFTASYASAVHELTGKLRGQPRKHFGKTKSGSEFGGGTGKGYYWDPQGKAQPQFLRFALTDNATKILSIIKAEAKIPK